MDFGPFIFLIFTPSPPFLMSSEHNLSFHGQQLALTRPGSCLSSNCISLPTPQPHRLPCIAESPKLVPARGSRPLALLVPLPRTLLPHSVFRTHGNFLTTTFCSVHPGTVRRYFQLLLFENTFIDWVYGSSTSVQTPQKQRSCPLFTTEVPRPRTNI